MFIKKSRENIFKEMDEDSYCLYQDDGRRRLSLSILGVIYNKQSGTRIWYSKSIENPRILLEVSNVLCFFFVIKVIQDKK